MNGEDREIAIAPARLLLEVLREDLGLTGTKRGCDDSSCGCCAVLVDGVPMLACAALAASYEGCEITTIEGLGALGRARSGPGRIRRVRGCAVRLLHAGFHDHDGRTAEPESESVARRDPRGAFEQSLPLHRLHADLRKSVRFAIEKPSRRSATGANRSAGRSAALGSALHP